VVAAALKRAGCEAETWTVRPRGHPFSRRLEVEPDLERAWRDRAGSWWAVVDEGPGLSGSSMASVAEKLSHLGVPDGRIVLFPSWEPSGEQFVSDAARARWHRHRKYTAEYRPPAGLEEISAGGWRRLVWQDEHHWPAVQPQHERRKFLEDGRVLWKFSGLGRFGRSRMERAERLWRAGFGPRPLGLENGFLRMEWVAGPRVREATPDFLDAVARYLRFLEDEFPGGDGAPPEMLAEMIRMNTGREWPGPLPEEPRCGIDGRILPHEWVRTAGGYIKTDALDHHDDHFLPGCQSIAWDAAGAAIELGLDADAAECLRRACSAPALGFYQRAYAAFRTGYAALARTAIAGTPDAARFRELEEKYRPAH
jgi:hypothetical protein